MLKPSNLGKEPCDAFAASVPTSSVAAYMIFFVECLYCRQGSPDAIFSEISFSSGPVEVPAKGKIATSIDRYIFKNRWATALYRKQSHIFTSRLFQIWRVSRTAKAHPPTPRYSAHKLSFKTDDSKQRYNVSNRRSSKEHFETCQF